MTILTSPVSTPVRRHRASSRVKRIFGRTLIYGALIFWAFVCLFPIYWTVTTSFKSAVDVTQGHLIPWLDFQPDWKGWRSIGLSPDTILRTSNPRDEFVSRFENSVITSVGASLLALVLGSLAAYGLSRTHADDSGRVVRTPTAPPKNGRSFDRNAALTLAIVAPLVIALLVYVVSGAQVAAQPAPFLVC